VAPIGPIVEADWRLGHVIFFSAVSRESLPIFPRCRPPQVWHAPSAEKITRPKPDGLSLIAEDGKRLG
jgi:hypothetical protein